MVVRSSSIALPPCPGEYLPDPPPRAPRRLPVRTTPGMEADLAVLAGALAGHLPPRLGAPGPDASLVRYAVSLAARLARAGELPEQREQVDSDRPAGPMPGR